MNFSTGQKIFALSFIIVFAGAMIWTYRKDLKLHKVYYKKVWVVLLGIVLTILAFKYLAYYLHE